MNRHELIALIRKITGDNVSVRRFGAVGDGTTNDTAAIQDAVDYAQESGKPLFFPSGTYCVDSVTIGSNLYVFGENPITTIIKQRSLAGAAIFANYTSTEKSNIHIEGIGFDVDLKDSGINIRNVVGLTIRNCRFNDVPYWSILVGIDSARATETTRTSRQIIIENCQFFNTTQTYEHVGLFNLEDATVRDCYFEGGMSGGIGVGVWQNTVGVLIENNHFKDITKGVYYSVTTDHVVISKNRFEGCTVGVQGANESDFGLFGAGWANGIFLNDNLFTDCVDIACEIGAVRNASLRSNNFVGNQNNALVISYGNRLSSTTINQTVNLSVSDCHFWNNNTSGTLHTLHPAILFNEGGGTIYATFTGCTIHDTQGTPTQRNPVVFSGNFTWSGIRFIGCRLSPYGGADSISTTNSASVSDVWLVLCTDVSGIPSGATHFTGS